MTEPRVSMIVNQIIDDVFRVTVRFGSTIDGIHMGSWDNQRDEVYPSLSVYWKVRLIPTVRDTTTATMMATN